jgi:hypothetical protein
MALKKRLKASSPPAEAPTPTTGKSAELVTLCVVDEGLRAMDLRVPGFFVIATIVELNRCGTTGDSLLRGMPPQITLRFADNASAGAWPAEYPQADPECVAF